MVRGAQERSSGIRLHVLPNITAPLIVQVSLALSWAILTEAGLSFLGLGAQPPNPRHPWSIGVLFSVASSR